MKSGDLNFLELSGPLQACNGTALPWSIDKKGAYKEESKPTIVSEYTETERIYNAVPSHKMARWSHLQLKDCGQGLEA
jgi:hypothetical protein